jgi:hypothetical protein
MRAMPTLPRLFHLSSLFLSLPLPLTLPLLSLSLPPSPSDSPSPSFSLGYGRRSLGVGWGQARSGQQIGRWADVVQIAGTLLQSIPSRGSWVRGQHRMMAVALGSQVGVAGLALGER